MMNINFCIAIADVNHYSAPTFEVEECVAEQGYIASTPIEDVGKDEEVPFF